MYSENESLIKRFGFRAFDLSNGGKPVRKRVYSLLSRTLEPSS